MILLCYDGSRHSREAIAGAAPLLASRQAVVLHVHRPATEVAIPIGGVPVGRPAAEVEAAVREHAQDIARRGCEIAREAGFDAEARTVEARGRTADAIVDVAGELDAEVIVVGTRGLGGVRSALLGSVSAALVHADDAPVLVMPSSSASDSS